MRLLLSVSLSVLLLSACTPSSKLVGSWNDQSAQGKDYHKVLVMALFPKMETRVAAEEAMVSELQAKGIKARVSHDQFPMVGKADELLALARDSAMIASLKEGFREKIIKSGADGLMMVSAYDVQKSKEYHSGGPSITVAGPAYGYYPNGYYTGASPNYGNYYDYYGYHVATVHSQGYYTTSSTYYIQSHLYDVASEKLIYTAQSKTVDYKNLNEEAAKLGGLIASDIVEKGVVSSNQ